MLEKGKDSRIIVRGRGKWLEFSLKAFLKCPNFAICSKAWTQVSYWVPF